MYCVLSINKCCYAKIYSRLGSPRAGPEQLKAQPDKISLRDFVSAEPNSHNMGSKLLV